MEKLSITTRQLGPLSIAVISRDEVTADLVERFKVSAKTNVAFANTNLITQAYRKPEIAEALKSFLILNDGIGLTIASKFFHGQGFLDNLNGTDFTPHLLKALPPETRVFLYGSKPHVLGTASMVLEQTCGVKVVGVQDGYAAVEPKELCERINRLGAQVVLVALGNPRQEEWIAVNGRHLDAQLCVGVGAFLDFTAGEFKRAPKWVQKIHMEWFYRLMNEPKRLARRYTIDILVFMWICRLYANGKAA